MTRRSHCVFAGRLSFTREVYQPTCGFERRLATLSLNNAMHLAVFEVVAVTISPLNNPRMPFSQVVV
jgi:hypothetical protein